MLEDSKNVKPVFCLVDPSLKDLVGHHYEYDRAVVEGAQAGGYDVVTLAHRTVIKEISARLPLRPCFNCDIWAVPEGVPNDPNSIEIACNEQFYTDLKAAVADLDLGGDSVVFGHMVTSRQLHGWARFALEQAAAVGPTIVLLLRYQPEHYVGRLAEEAFEMLQTAALNGRLRLSSDSSRLADQLQRLTTLPIETWPLPHTTELEAAQAQRTAKFTRLRVVSLGNARDEKGIIELLNAVRIVQAAGWADRFEFVFQVNDANADVAPAIEQFASETHAHTTLLTAALSTDDYFDLLKSADIVALPYWREIYVARTSGVFLEAVAAGKPVICTADTWMSDQLSLAGAGVRVKNRDDNDLAMGLIAMCRDYEALFERAQSTRALWLEIHNPASFMRALLHGEVAPKAESSRPSVAVLYPWGDALQNAAGAALRVNLFIRFLAERSGRVRVLEDGDHADVMRDGVSFEATPVARLIHSHWSYRWISRVARYLLGAKNGEEFYFGLMLLPRFSKSFRRRINEIVRNSDLIFLEYPFWAPSVEQACQAHGKTFILTNYDVISDQIRVSAPLRWLTALLERRSMSGASARVVVTEEDRSKFRAWGLDSLVSSNCVDAVAAAHRLPTPSTDLVKALCELPPDTRHLFVFVGSKFRPNVLAAEEVRRIAGAFTARYPDLKAHFVVAGACLEPTREPGFSALGRIDDLTLKLLYENCTAVLIPLTLGTGLSLKTVEALAAGQVIVGSEIAFRGIPKGEGDGWIAEDDFSLYPDTLARLIGDADYRDALSSQARVYGRQLDFRTAFAPYLDLAPRLAESAPVSAPLIDKYKRFVLEAVEANIGLGAIDRALQLTDALIGAHPETGEAYKIRAELWLNHGRGDAQAALSDLDAAMANGVPAADVLRVRSKVLSATGSRAEADQALDAAVAITLNLIWMPATELGLRAKLWTALHAGDKQWIYRITSGAFALRNDALPLDYQYLMANAAIDVGGDLQTALEAAKSALNRGYDGFWGSMLIGEILDRLGRYAEAVDAFHTAASIASTPDLKVVAVNSAARDLWSLLDAADYDEILDRTSIVIARWPDHPVANYLRAEALTIVGRELLEACDCYIKALHSGFRPYHALLKYGQLKTLIGGADEALDCLIEASSDVQTAEERHVLQMAIADATEQASRTFGDHFVKGVLARSSGADLALTA